MDAMGNQITQIDYARAGIVTEQMRAVATKEGICAENVREAVAAGRIAIPANIHHVSLNPEGVGSCLDGVPLRTKVNVNLGISGDLADEEEEWRKVDVALELGAEAIMDLSNSAKDGARSAARSSTESPAMVGTVPMYDAIGYLEKALIDITPDDFLEVMPRARRGRRGLRDRYTRGMNRRAIERVQGDGAPHEHRQQWRLAYLRLDGGNWQREPRSIEFYDEVLAILHEHDVTVSLGDAMRPGQHLRRQRRRPDRRAHRNRQAHAARVGCAACR